MEMMAGPAKVRYAVGVVDGQELCVEFETDSRIKAWLFEQKIGWREIWRLLRGLGVRNTFTATFS